MLETVCRNVFHAESYRTELPRIVYEETGRIYYHADNRVTSKAFAVDVHFYTATEFDPIFTELENLFSDEGIPFDLEKIEHGSTKDEENLTYYLFKCTV